MARGARRAVFARVVRTESDGRRGEKIVQQRRLTRTEETRDESNWDRSLRCAGGGGGGRTRAHAARAAHTARTRAAELRCLLSYATGAKALHEGGDGVRGEERDEHQCQELQRCA